MRKLVDKAQRKIAAKKFDQVAALLNPVLQSHPHYAHAWYLRGIASEGTKMAQHAVNDYSKAIALRPKFKEALLARSRLALLAKKHAVARHDYAAVLAVEENCFDALIGLGRVELDAGAAAEALNYFQRALSLCPDSVDANLRVALAQRFAGPPVFCLCFVSQRYTPICSALVALLSHSHLSRELQEVRRHQRSRSSVPSDREAEQGLHGGVVRARAMLQRAEEGRHGSGCFQSHCAL
jgi:tetratricopeptide (TPR) repeat protein